MNWCNIGVFKQRQKDSNMVYGFYELNKLQSSELIKDNQWAILKRIGVKSKKDKRAYL